MAVWYCGSVQHAAVAQWAALHAYVVGDIVRGLAAPTDVNARCWRVSAITTGNSGAAEPSWNRTKGSTTTDAGVTWTEVTGNSTYGWSAPHSRVSNAVLAAWIADGDTVFVASNHSYSVAAAYDWQVGNSSKILTNRVICVNAAGSVPPVAADLTTGAVETTTGNSNFDVARGVYVYGVEFVMGSGASGTATMIQNSGSNGPWEQSYEQCKFTIATTGVSSRINPTTLANRNLATLNWRNCTVKFGATGQGISTMVTGRFTWEGGSVDAAGSAPTNLFIYSASAGGNLTRLVGVDLNALGTNVIIPSYTGTEAYQFINCRLGTGYVINGAFTTAVHGLIADVVICDTTTKNYVHERHTAEGDLLTEIVNVVAGGANDGVTAFSWKVTTSSIAQADYPFDCFTRTVWNDATGSSKTLTIEILNSAVTLKDTEIWVEVEYLNSASYPTVAWATSNPYIGSGTNLTTSSATWDTTGISSPIKQYLTISFTPQMKGYIRYTVRVARASKTIWIDPKATIV